MNATKNSNGASEQRVTVVCPFCRAQNCELLSFFGQNLLTSQYYCHSCHTPFEAVRWHEINHEKYPQKN